MTAPSGHLYCSLVRDDGKLVTRPVHAHVIITYVGPRPNGMMCRHLDGDPKNNNISNLKWGTAKENGEDRSRHHIERAKLRQMKIDWFVNKE